MHPLVSLLIGLVCAALGGELFVRGAVGIAEWLRIPAGIIGATIAAFATSSPELAVSIQAAVAGAPQIALGDALGSNVVNIGLILGIALLFGPLQGSASTMRRDIPLAVGAPLLTLALVWDRSLSRIDAGVLLSVFLVWLIATTNDARRQKDASAEVLAEHNHGRALTFGIVGLGLLILAGDQIVRGAKWVGGELGWNPFIVGATLVALGTSTPELATTLISRIRGHDEVGLGTVIGSNVFNSLFIVGVAAAIAPISVELGDVGVGLGFGIALMLASIPLRGNLGRARGFLLLALYTGYVTTLIWRA